MVKTIYKKDLDRKNATKYTFLFVITFQTFSNIGYIYENAK